MTWLPPPTVDHDHASMDRAKLRRCEGHCPFALEMLAEYRPALTEAGAAGLEAEIFIYDTLAGGAGFSPHSFGQALFEEGLRIQSESPGGCDAPAIDACRSFKNKLEHRLLDRKLGEQLLRHVLIGVRDGVLRHLGSMGEVELPTALADRDLIEIRASRAAFSIGT